MWRIEPGSSQAFDGNPSHAATPIKRAALQILPCTVSQLLNASKMNSDSFAICDWELHQVSVVGIVRGFAPFVTNIQYSVDDMTGPPLNVKQWVNTEDCAVMTSVPPGSYVKVAGRLQNFKGQRSLLAMNIRCIKDLNEITSHMMEVVQAHMQLFGKVSDVNMNVPAASLPGRVYRPDSGGGGGHPEGILLTGLSTIQRQVLHVIRTVSVHREGISFHDLKTQLDFLSVRDIRTALVFLINEGHIFTTIDEHHFKSA
ncbi:replication protein A 32 kDa subunit-like [Aulostomus maculatus]